MTTRQLSQDMKNRLTYLVFCKQLSVAIARGYVFYDDLAGLSILWGYDEQEVLYISSLIKDMFNTYEREGSISEQGFYTIATIIPIILPFIKEPVDDVIRRWLLGILLPPSETNEGLVVNESSYNTAFGLSTYFLTHIQEISGNRGLINSVWMELYNPLIHQGITPTKTSSISGINSVKTHLMNRFGSLAKVTETSSTEMLALISEHIFCPEVLYLGNIYTKEQVDDIHIPTLSQTEIEDLLRNRMTMILNNFPNSSLEEIKDNDAKPFKTIDPLGVLARHYGFVEGDLVRLNSLIPSETSISSRKSEIYLVS